MLQLAFHRGTGTILDRIIAMRTNAGAGGVHCEILFSDGTTFSSDLASGGTRFTDGSDLKLHPFLWTTVEVEPANEAAVRAFCTTNLHERYGLVGIAAFLFDLKDLVPQDPFCSQICTAALQSQGLFEFLDATQTSPQELYIAAQARAEARKTALIQHLGANS